MPQLAAKAFQSAISNWQFSIARSVRDVRNQRDLTSALERGLQLPLVHRAGARNAARQDLPALRHERTQQLCVLVIDVVDLVRTELADLAAAEHRPALAVCLVARLLLPATSGGAPASHRHLTLHPLEAVVVSVLALGRRPALSRLPLRRQAALHATALGLALAL